MKQKLYFGAILLLGVMLAIGLPLLAGDKVSLTKWSVPQGQAFIQVEQGDKPGALAYYTEIGVKLALPKPLIVPDPETPSATTFNAEVTLQTLLDWAGYKELLATDLEKLPSFEINDPSVLATRVTNSTQFRDYFASNPIGHRDIVATRYFSPKITDVSGLSAPGELKYGFRKVIRLKVRPDSLAASPPANIDAIWVLFNYFVKTSALGTQPLELGSSVNIQLIAVRKPSITTGYPLYWLVFDEARNGVHPLIGHLNATFDARDPELVKSSPSPSPNPIKPYFVPLACAQCHGVTKDRGKLNFLDTDHWFQRVLADKTMPGNDFPLYAPAPHGVLLDGGKDTTSAEFKKAFADIRLMNQEIEAQNTAVPGNGFQTKAVQHWNKLHETNDRFLKPVERGVPIAFGGAVVKWERSNEDDRQLIELLDRYCYRCHSSVKYNVYEKLTVRFKKQDILNLIDPAITVDLENRMPQDRLLTPAEIEQLKALVTKLPE